MSKRMLVTMSILAIGPALAGAGMVSQTWGPAERVGHPGTIRFEALPDSQVLMICDL